LLEQDLSDYVGPLVDRSLFFGCHSFHSAYIALFLFSSTLVQTQSCFDGNCFAVHCCFQSTSASHVLSQIVACNFHFISHPHNWSRDRSFDFHLCLLIARPIVHVVVSCFGGPAEPCSIFVLPTMPCAIGIFDVHLGT